MGWLKIIDGVLDIKWVRYALLVASLILLIASVVFRVQLFFVETKLQKQVAANTILTNQIATQNLAIEQWKAEGVKAQEKSNLAIKAADAIRNNYEKRLTNLKKFEFREGCCEVIEDFKTVMIRGTSGGSP